MANKANVRIILSVLSVYCLLILQSCKKPDMGTPAVEKDLFTIMVENEWKITQFDVLGDDITGQYRDYILKFSTDGELSATDGQVIYRGQWNISYERDDLFHQLCGFGNGCGASKEDEEVLRSPDNDEIHFNMRFETGGPLDSLEDFWHIRSSSQEILRLRDSREEDLSTYFLDIHSI